MSDEDDLKLRGARDRLFDLLGHFGKTAPLRDTPVEQLGLVVPYDTKAEINLDPGQTDVRYLLRHRDGTTVPGSTNTLGTNGPTQLTTPEVRDDVTYLVLGRKTKPNEREAYLHDVAPIKVGLDATIPARILAPPLQPAEPDVKDSDPRIVDHGTKVRIEVDQSQAGVDYDAVVGEGAEWATRSVETVRGNGGTIQIDTVAFEEDALLRVRATRAFDPADDREDQVAVLDVELPLAVRPDTGLAVAFADTITAHGSGGSLVVQDTQRSAMYQVRIRPLSWSDIAGSGEPNPTVAVPVPGEPDVEVIWPPAVEGTLDPVEGDGEGNGGSLTFDVSLADDTIAVVFASKEHYGVRTVVELERPGIAFVTPDPDRELQITVRIRGNRVVGVMRVDGGQSDVRYEFDDQSSSSPLLPAYFSDLEAGGVERGVGTRRIGYDFVVERSDDREAVIDVGDGLDLPLRFDVRAVKGRTGVAVPMSRSVVIGTDPPVALDSEDLAPGEKGRLVVTDSVDGETYRPFVGGEPIRRSKTGNGQDLVFLTDPLRSDTTIEMWMVAPSTSGRHVLERSVLVEATVWPPVDARVDAPALDPANPDALGPRLVDHGATPTVDMGLGEPGMTYQIVSVDDGAVSVLSGDPQPGTGVPLGLTLGPLSEDVDLRVRVSKLVEIGDRIVARTHVHGTPLHVAVKANRDIGVSFGDGITEHAAAPLLSIEESQSSARYQPHTRRLTDEEYFPGPGVETFTAAKGDERIEIGSPWSTGLEVPAGFSDSGAETAGNGDTLQIPLDPVGHDLIAVVTATKTHVGGATSQVMLARAATSFARPDPEPGLALTAYVVGTRIRSVRVSGGQRRVLYHLRNGRRGIEHDLPAYAHDVDRGVGLLRVGVDLIPTRPSWTPEASWDGVVSLSRRPRLPATIVVRAALARTAVATQLERSAEVRELPAIELVDGPLDSGSSARVAIATTVTGERYHLVQDGRIVGDPVDGDGTSTELVSAPLAASTTLEVHVSRPEAEGIPVVRVVSIDVPVG